MNNTSVAVVDGQSYSAANRTNTPIFTRLAMTFNNVVVTVKNEQDVPEIRELLLEQTRLSRMEPGCERFELYQSQTDPKVFILVERWSSQEALDLHRLAKAYTEIYKPKVLPKVDRIPYPCDLLEP